MQIISISMIIEINNILKENSLDFKIHLKDSCGGQTMRIEELNPCSNDNLRAQLHEQIRSYFEKEHIKLKFSDDGDTFWAV